MAPSFGQHSHTLYRLKRPTDVHIADGVCAAPWPGVTTQMAHAIVHGITNKWEAPWHITLMGRRTQTYGCQLWPHRKLQHTVANSCHGVLLRLPSSVTSAVMGVISWCLQCSAICGDSSGVSTPWPSWPAHPVCIVCAAASSAVADRPARCAWGCLSLCKASASARSARSAISARSASALIHAGHVPHPISPHSHLALLLLGTHPSSFPRPPLRLACL